jgi:peptidoglycan hydrolase CwlO-like protein
MERIVVFLSLIAFVAPAVADENATCPAPSVKLKPSERIERLEQRVLSCDLDLRMIAKDKDDQDKSLKECRRGSDRCESEVGKLKDELLASSKKRLELEEVVKDQQSRINAMMGKYEILSTALMFGVLAILALLVFGMVWSYRKYRKLLAPKKMF